jgi:hypothetical protein
VNVRTSTIDPSITGLRPILRYSGTNIKEPNPNARFGYETRSDALVGVILNSSEYSPMYTEGPRRAQFPRKEYIDTHSNIKDFLVFDHWSGSLGFSSGTGYSAWP